MKRTITIALLLAVAITPCMAGEDAKPDMGAKTQEKKPLVEVAFVLDTTGSMSGLIDGAKRKIWFIANQIILGKPRPDLRIALVPYRDKGDEYVTKVFDLTGNIDEVYKNLMAFKAAGGGDTPENVNQALHDAVNKLSWSKDRKTLKIIYLVGDCPPHNEYTDVPTYDKIAYSAINDKGIYINTVLCGSNNQAAAVWKEIAKKAEGAFAQIDQGGGVQHIATPYDTELAKLNAELTSTAVYYGKTPERRRAELLSAAATSMPAGAAADRVTYLATKAPGKASTVGESSDKSGRRVGAKDLVDEVRDGKADLAKIEQEHLPEKMQKMDLAAQKKYIAAQQVRRDEILKKISTLSAKRAEHVKKLLASAKGSEAKEGFDYKVVEAMKVQAAKKDITYK